MKTLGKIALILTFAFFGFACQSFVTPVGNLRQTPTPAKVETTERTDDSSERLETVRQQDFNFVYVFRRKDGAPLDSDDRKFLRANSPPETNQWVVSDDGKTAIAGSNYEFPPENLESLKARFIFEDRSKPKADLPANADNQPTK